MHDKNGQTGTREEYNSRFSQWTIQIDHAELNWPF